MICSSPEGSGQGGPLALRGRAMPEDTTRSDKAWQLGCADRSYRQFVLCIPTMRLFLLHCVQGPVIFGCLIELCSDLDLFKLHSPKNYK